MQHDLRSRRSRRHVPRLALISEPSRAQVTGVSGAHPEEVEEFPAVPRQSGVHSEPAIRGSRQARRPTSVAYISSNKLRFSSVRVRYNT